MSQLRALGLKSGRSKQDVLQATINRAAAGSVLTIPPGLIRVGPRYTATTPYGQSLHAILIDKPLTLILTDVTIISETAGIYGQILVTSPGVTIRGGTLTGDTEPSDKGASFLSSRCGILISKSADCVVEDTVIRNMTQGINLYDCTNARLTRVTAEHCRGSGIISFSADNSVIENCTIRNNADGALSMYANGTNNIVRDNVISEDRPESYGRLQGVTCEREVGSTFLRNTVTGMFYGFDVKNDSQDCVFDGNQAHQNQFNFCIRLINDPGNPNVDSNNMQIRNNDFTGTLPQGANGNAGIIISGGTGHVIENNTVNHFDIIVSGVPYDSNQTTPRGVLTGNIFV